MIKLVPEFVVILGPKLTKMVKWGANNSEALRPHELLKKRRYPSKAIAGNAVRRSSGLELLLNRQREKASASRFNVVKKLARDAMVGDLEDTPSSTCMACELKGIGVGEINDWNRVLLCPK